MFSSESRDEPQPATAPMPYADDDDSVEPAAARGCQRLGRWCLRMTPNKLLPFPENIGVEGYRVADGYVDDDNRVDMEFYHSSTIAERHSATLLQTSSGKFYRLAGQIDRQSARRQGWPEAVVNAFEHGFPSNWKVTLRNHLKEPPTPAGSKMIIQKQEFATPSAPAPKTPRAALSAKMLSASAHKALTPVTPRSDADEVSSLASDSDVSTISVRSRGGSKKGGYLASQTPTASGVKRKAPFTPMTPVPFSAKKPRLQAASPSPSWFRKDVLGETAPEPMPYSIGASAPVLEEITPLSVKKSGASTHAMKANSVLDHLELNQTRSGRRIMKPVAHWAGQAFRRDLYGNVIDIDVSLMSQDDRRKVDELKERRIAAESGTESEREPLSTRESTPVPASLAVRSSAPDRPAAAGRPTKAPADAESSSEEAENSVASYEGDEDRTPVLPRPGASAKKRPAAKRQRAAVPPTPDEDEDAAVDRPAKRPTKPTRKPRKGSEPARLSSETAVVPEAEGAAGPQGSEDEQPPSPAAEPVVEVAAQSPSKRGRKPAATAPASQAASAPQPDQSPGRRRGGRSKPAAATASSSAGRASDAETLPEDDDASSVASAPASKRGGKSAKAKAEAASKKQKAAASRSPGEGTADATDSMQTPVRPGRREASVKAAAAIATHEDDEEVAGQFETGAKDWTPEEVRRLHHARDSVTPQAKNFWQQVSSLMPGRTAEECQAKHFESFATPHEKSRKSKRAQASASTEESPFQADERGRVFQNRNKDKRKIRNVIKRAEKGHADDVFDATPYKAKDNVQMDISDAEDDDEKYFKGHGDMIAADSEGTPGGAAGPSPGILKAVNRDEMDSYIGGLAKRTRGTTDFQSIRHQQQALKEQATRPKAPSAAAVKAVKQLSRKRRLSEDAEDESGPEPEYMWSDVDQSDDDANDDDYA
eukprot:TRINITY_DN557_c0_g1_i1.p2 TRINITY_DN557_c0_g1~~TRINITY_DN557_c0_g1_i1.p2  ORF type:complete len:936 (+),score=310.96 TRINITY_DN557_c0_g1_i1:4520-7327(+)